MSVLVCALHMIEQDLGYLTSILLANQINVNHLSKEVLINMAIMLINKQIKRNINYVKYL